MFLEDEAIYPPRRNKRRMIAAESIPFKRLAGQLLGVQDCPEAR